MTILETRDLRKVYGAGDTEVRALDGVHLTVEKGEFVAVVGTSGSGKSTLLHMLGGLDRPTSGSVTVDGREIFQLKDEELTIFRRRKIGFVFQNYNLVPVLNVYENIVLPIRLDGKIEDRAYVEQIIATLGLEKKLQNLPNNLSGGQQQRVAIARALAAKPAIILADEPTGNLDSTTGRQVLDTFHALKRAGKTIVLITHDPGVAAEADRAVQIRDGRIYQGAYVPIEPGDRSTAVERGGRGVPEEHGGRSAPDERGNQDVPDEHGDRGSSLSPLTTPSRPLEGPSNPIGGPR